LIARIGGKLAGDSWSLISWPEATHSLRWRTASLAVTAG
jgi:hypothetical protein